jgi:hypothetical protein
MNCNDRGQRTAARDDLRRAQAPDRRSTPRNSRPRPLSAASFEGPTGSGFQLTDSKCYLRFVPNLLKRDGSYWFCRHFLPKSVYILEHTGTHRSSQPGPLLLGPRMDLECRQFCGRPGTIIDDTAYVRVRFSLHTA